MSPAIRDLKGRPIDEEVSSRDVPEIVYQQADAQSPERDAIRSALTALGRTPARTPAPVEVPEDLGAILEALDAAVAVIQDQVRVVTVQVAALRERVAHDQAQLQKVARIERLLKDEAD